MIVPTNEIGYAKGNLATWGALGPDIEEQNTDMQWPKNLGVYEQMRSDAQVYSVIKAVTLPILSTGWSLDPNGVREEVLQLVAADLGLPIKGREPEPVAVRRRGRFSWSEHMAAALLEIVFGHSYFEQVYKIVDLQARLWKLAPRPHGTISKFNVAKDGGLVSIEQHPEAGSTKPVIVPVDRLVAYVHGREGGNWAGRSMLRAAYKNWMLKDRLMRTQTLTVDRNGLGVPIYTAAPFPDGMTAAADIDSWVRNERTEGLKLAMAFRSGETAGASIPHGATITLRGVEGDLPDADKPIRYHDEQIARAALAHFLNLGVQTGSWALGSTLGDFFSDSLNGEATHFQDVTQQHVIDDLVDKNWGESEPAPRLVFDKIGASSPLTAEAIKGLVDAGVLTTDDALEEYLREVLGLPVFENHGVERTRRTDSSPSSKEIPA